MTMVPQQPDGADPVVPQAPPPAVPPPIPGYAPAAGAAPYAPQPYYASAPQAYAPSAPAPRGLSIASLVLGIVGLVLLFGLASLAGVILGHVARRREPAGQGLALAGLITGYIGLGAGILLLGVSVVYFVVVLGFAAAAGSYSGS